MSDEPELCGAIGEHPELGELRCELPAGHEPPHKAPAPDDPDGAIEWDDEPASVTAGAVFDIESFVKSLPEGVALCPQCLGIGAVNEDPPFDPHVHRCATCRGYGRTLTGSLVNEHANRPCVDCKGYGFVPNEPGALPASPARSVDFAAELAPRDAQGRTPDDPEFDWTAVVHDVEPIPAAEPA